MVNYKRVVCEVALVAALLAVASAAPAPHGPDCHYDQRQNGSENYRLNIDGVVIAVAPADSLLAAASEIDLSDLLDLTDYPEHSSASPLEPKPDDAKPQDSKPSEAKPEGEKPSDLSVLDVNQNSVKPQRKEAFNRKQEKAQRFHYRKSARLKTRLAQFLLPLLRKTRHH